MPLDPQQSQALRKRCEVVLPGFEALEPAAEFRRLADWCEAHAVEADRYGEGALIEAFERKIATLLGKPLATFVPSGTMAQMAAMRVWTERARLDRFGMHPTSHLALHENQSHAALMHLHGVPIGDRLRPMTAEDLAVVRQPLAAIIVELPIRESGGQLPTWEQLEALKHATKARGIALHLDGARLWESAAHYGRTYAEIVDGFDSIYVSLYKGLGAVAGAMLAGDEAFIAEARLWRARMGGTLYQAYPMVASAAMRFDERIAAMPALYERAVTFARTLGTLPWLRVDSTVPHTNLLHLHFDAPAEAVMAARDAVAARDGCWLVDRVRPSEVPGWSRTELYVGDRLLGIGDDRVAAAFAALGEALVGARDTPQPV